MNSFVILLLLTGRRLISHSKNILMCDLLEHHNASGQSITIIKGNRTKTSKSFNLYIYIINFAGSGKKSFLLEDGVRYVIDPSIVAELNLPSVCQLNDGVVLAIPRDGLVEQNGCTLKNYTIPDRFNGTYAGMQCLNHIPTTAFNATEILQFRQKILHDNDFLSYERCIIDSPKELDERSTYYQQPHCASSSSSYPPIGMELTCTMGFGHEKNGNMGPARQAHGCLSRGIHSRAFKYTYAFGDTNGSDSLSLVKELINKRVESLVFIGDSVTIQLGKQLACDILRFDKEDLTIIPKWPSIFRGVKYGVAGIQLNVGNGTSAESLDFRVVRTNDYVCNSYNYRGVMYVSPECISEKVAEESAYQDIFSELKRIAEGTKGRVVIVYNIGLHMSRNHSSWIFKSVARVTYSKENADYFYIDCRLNVLIFRLFWTSRRTRATSKT